MKINTQRFDGYHRNWSPQLIQIYCVFLIGEPLLLDDKTQEFGFYRNEYVVSLSEDRAVAAAKIRTMKRLKHKEVRFIDGKPLTLKVEKIELGMPPWRLLRNEGFIFFPMDS